jgi:Holliday junction resolvase RusA-like endonuclease
MTISFTIPGKPFGKQRPRAGKTFGGHARMFTPKETVQFEGTVGDIARPLFPVALQGPVKLRIVATYPIPASWSKKKRAAHDGQFCCSKPDADNIGKAIKDGLNRIAWADDAQVADVRVVKRWGFGAGQTFVQVEALS